MAEFEEEDGEVVDEEQGVDQGESELDDVLVKNLCSVLQQVDTIEQPEAGKDRKLSICQFVNLWGQTY